MVTDDERREVARRLREYVDLPDDWWQETCAEFYVEKCVFGNVDRHSEAELFTRLADLIEPSCDRDADRTCRDTDCDTESITCSECGEITRYTLFWVDVDGGKTVKGHRPRFCSNCGRRVLYDSNDYI